MRHACDTICIVETMHKRATRAQHDCDKNMRTKIIAICINDEINDNVTRDNDQFVLIDAKYFFDFATQHVEYTRAIYDCILSQFAHVDFDEYTNDAIVNCNQYAQFIQNFDIVMIQNDDDDIRKSILIA